MPDSSVAAPPHRSGFVSIVGRPNAGKSTLLNALVGGKLAIVSEKPQTTRLAVQGVLTLPQAQIVFLDTPGIHHAATLLNKRMMDAVRASLQERDLLLFVADCSSPMTAEDRHALDMIRNPETPALLLLNKIDRLEDKRKLLPRLEEYQTERAFLEFIPVSALTGEGLDRVRDAILAHVPEGPAYFPPDYITDQPERFLAAELIREKILRETRQEVPHSVAVIVDKWEETPRLTRIAATIYVERAGQKAIVIGSKGATLKKVATLARHEMEALFGVKVFLEVFVKVRPNWRESPEFLNAADWHSLFSTAESDDVPCA
jgi:GTP-binding protein Era